MSKKVESGTSAMWDKEVTLIFCDLCIAEIELGNRPTTYFNKEGWDNIASRFKELTGREYGRLKFKNKWDHLKKEWKMWKELKRGSTGLGWDPIKRTIAAPDEWWAEKLEATPAAKKFKQCGIDPDLEEKLDFMFRGVVATGKIAFTPVEEGFGGIPEDLQTNSSFHDEETQSVNRMEMGESSTQSKKQKVRRKKIDNDTFFQSSFDKLIDAFAAGPPVPKPDNTIFDCIRILKTIPQVVADKLFFGKCMKKLEDPTRRHIFMNMDEEFRLGYLQAIVNE